MTAAAGCATTPPSSPTLTNCTFTANSASGRKATGGGMYNDSSSPDADNCTFTANSASTHGGGMYNESSSPTLTNCTFTGNRPTPAAGCATTRHPRR